jgi:hypothetical protein
LWLMLSLLPPAEWGGVVIIIVILGVHPVAVRVQRSRDAKDGWFLLTPSRTHFVKDDFLFRVGDDLFGLHVDVDRSFVRFPRSEVRSGILKAAP